MPPKRPTQDQIDKARQKAEQADAHLKAILAREDQAAQRSDTRRRIVLGGLLLDAAQTDAQYTKIITALMGRITRGRDHAAFAGWTPPGPVKHERAQAASETTPQPGLFGDAPRE